MARVVVCDGWGLAIVGLGSEADGEVSVARYARRCCRVGAKTRVMRDVRARFWRVGWRRRCVCCAECVGGEVGEGGEEGGEGVGRWSVAWRCWRKSSRVEQMIRVVPVVCWSRM